MSFWTGDPGGFEKLQRFTPQQQGAFGQTLQGAQGQIPDIFRYLQQMLSGDPSQQKAFEAPAMRQFSEKIIPGLAERFSGMGQGAQGSSAFQQSLGQAGAGLAENLQSQRANRQQGAASQLQQLLQLGMTPQFEQSYRQPAQGFLSTLLGGLGGGFSKGLGNTFGSFLSR